MRVTLSPGTTLGSFEVFGLLGAGGMGEVTSFSPESNPLVVVAPDALHIVAGDATGRVYFLRLEGFEGKK